MSKRKREPAPVFVDAADYFKAVNLMLEALNPTPSQDRKVWTFTPKTVVIVTKDESA